MRTLNYTYTIEEGNQVKIWYDLNGVSSPLVLAYEISGDPDGSPFATRQIAEQKAESFIEEIRSSGPARNQVND